MLAFVLRLPIFFILFFLLLLAPVSNGKEEGDAHRQTYVVLLEKPEAVVFVSSEERQSWYESFLSKATAAKSRMVYSYGDVVSGFAARLSGEEVEAMQEMDGFVAALPDRVVPLQTTHTPGFLGLNLAHGQWSNSPSGEGVIIGMLDTGVASTHPSFRGDGMPPPPAKWRGRCQLNADDCNNKLIGYKEFTYGAGHRGREEEGRDLDTAGHGTHTASTAAGAAVGGAGVLGYANGTAVGMAPRAHLAVYKVCSELGCAYSDIMAAVDAAVEDGVDVLSVSLGGKSLPLYEDLLAVGAFRATRRGVFISCAAGNYGPSARTLSNEAPWVLTVAASTMDRSLRTTVRLGDGQELDGESLFHSPRGGPTADLPLVYPSRTPGLGYCAEGSLAGLDVKGKVVLCDRGGDTSRTGKADVVKKAGGAGMILANEVADGYSTIADVYPIPGAHLSFSDGSKVKAYINSSDNPTASFLVKGTLIGTSPSPVISSFSSRGPSQGSPGILKPDITGPGVNVVASWPFHVGRSAPAEATASSDSRFNVMSGTSMSTPHLSGIAALVKSAHPDWSPAAIKSAIMTTSDVLDRSGEAIENESLRAANLFAMGAGHVNPGKAADPGLVYDLHPDDYIGYLCRLRYTNARLATIVGHRVRCSQSNRTADAAHLNYPSISASLGDGVASVTVRRTVTNVGEATSVYWVKVEQPAGVMVAVSPGTLQFSKVNEKMSFTVRLSREGRATGPFSQGHLMWVSEKRVVRSPISISFS